MKCQYCSHNVKFWQPNCPACRRPLPASSYSTITEATQTLEQQSRRRLLQQVIQFALLCLTFIAIASLIRLDPPANPLPQENIRVAASATPTPVPDSPVSEVAAEVGTPSIVTEAPPPLPSPRATAVGQLSPISLFSEAEMAMMKGTASPSAVPRARFAIASRKGRVTPPSGDEVRPRRVTTPPAIGTPVSSPPKTPPVAVAEAKPDAPKLEVEAASVLLHSNTGLVTINSYVPARVYIDGVYSGSTPRSVKLLAGNHTISLLADGYHEYSRKIKVQGQQQVGILASMSKK